MVHYSVCPLCSAEKISKYFRCIDHFISGEEFDIYKCSSCGFEFTQDVPGESEIGRYYESTDYISHTDTSEGFSNKLYHVVRSVMLRRKKAIITKVTGLKKGMLLDIGSGTGHFAGKMKEAGWLVKGIEINNKARDFSISHFGLDVGEPEELQGLETGSFDCITLWHVLEHFHDPFKSAFEIFRILKPGGCAVIALPNALSSDSNYFRENWAARDVPRHLWHFTPSTFKLFSEKTGLKPEKIMNLPFDIFYISVLSEKYRGSKWPFLTGIIRAIPFTITSLFQIKKSSSLIYILRK
jgi:2-polyprenyl-3-methyl-5-hydroxy-6-metoxy-1,4-benzoquinol methylase